MTAKSTLLLVVSSLSLPLCAFAQGSLTPPAGPTPTMKRLDEVEPRFNLQSNPPPPGVATDLDSIHFAITQPGSYYLSSNLAVTKLIGIHINAEGVTVDLNGFEISGVPGFTEHGIEISPSSNRATIRNGSIKGFARGIQSATVSTVSRGSAFRDLAVSNCVLAGIVAGDGAMLESCRVEGSGGTYGIFAGRGSTIVNCTAVSNTTAYGIFAEGGSTIAKCTAQSNSSSAAVSAGIGTGEGCTVVHCTALQNSSTATTATPSTGMGFTLGTGSTIQNCTARGNKGNGIRVFTNCFVRENSCGSNGNGGDGAGIQVLSSDNRIESNNVTDNDRGIDVDGSGNLILKNSATGSSELNYAIESGNAFGPIAGVVGVGDISATAGAEHPWANFVY